MKTLLLFFTLLIFTNIGSAQTTAIPDPIFEQYLINNGYDTGTPDGVVVTANINSVTVVNVESEGISDLTGIEDFAALTILHCSDNSLTSLDVTQNIALTQLFCGWNNISTLDVSPLSSLVKLYCDFNQLSNLDITQNTLLTHLVNSNNQLTSLDISQNTSLILLKIDNNQISSLDVTQHPNLEDLQTFSNPISSLDVTLNTALINLDCHGYNLGSLDLSQNAALKYLVCYGSQLECLNLQSGGNGNLELIHAWSNNNLTCIDVDNVTYSNSTWVGSNFNFDAASSFSINCGPCTVGINETSYNDFLVYPNPTTGNISIDLGELKTNIKTTIRNSVGQMVLTKQFKSTNSVNLDVVLPKGLYFLQLEFEGEIITRKIIIE
jgi:hypothetical protein